MNKRKAQALIDSESELDLYEKASNQTQKNYQKPKFSGPETSDSNSDWVVPSKKAKKEKLKKSEVKSVQKEKKYADSDLKEGQDDDVEKLVNQLSELEEKATSLDKKRTSRIAPISYINERNRKYNVEKAEKAIRAETEAKKGSKADYDPFTRRPTRPVMMKLKKDSKKSDKEEEVKRKEKMEEEEISRKKMEEKKHEDSRKNEMYDPFVAHNFNIEIDLKFDAPFTTSTLRTAPTANKTAKKVTGPKRSTLKFDDYKRKKGLL